MEPKKKTQMKNILPLPGESWLYQPLLLPPRHWALHRGLHQSLYLPAIHEKDISIMDRGYQDFSIILIFRLLELLLRSQFIGSLVTYSLLNNFLLILLRNVNSLYTMVCNCTLIHA